MMGLIETCSVWESNSKYKELIQTEYIVYFMYFSIHNGMENVKLHLLYHYDNTQWN